MDLETENRLAALLMREAAELRRQADKEGVLAYLREPNKRHRPNSRFLGATVLGVQQSNRAVEVNEMWRVRQKELALDRRHEGISRDLNSGNRSHSDGNLSRRSGRFGMDDNCTAASASCSSKRESDHYSEGLRDEELEMFLNSRTKRGRGAIGPRMDETGPYLPQRSNEEEAIASSDVSNRRAYGPERPASLKLHEAPEVDGKVHVKREKKTKKSHSRSSDKEHYRKKHKSREYSRHKKKEKRSKHHR